MSIYEELFPNGLLSNDPHLYCTVRAICGAADEVRALRVFLQETFTDTSEPTKYTKTTEGKEE